MDDNLRERGHTVLEREGIKYTYKAIMTDYHLRERGHAVLEREERDDELGDVTKGRVEQPAQRLGRVQRELLRHKGETLGEGRNRKE